jgi:hypothetical protein
MTRREYKAGIPTTLGADITSSSTTITVDTYTNWPTGSGGNFWITIDAGKSQEERILCSAQSSGSITVAASGRGQDGTTASSHTKGATVWPSWSAQDADESNAHIEATGYASFSKSVHGLGSGDGVVVGTDKTQVLTAKTLTSPILNTPTINNPTISGTITGAVITNSNIVDGTITGTDIATGTITGANILDGTILDAEIGAGANIAQSKVASLTSDLASKAPLASPALTGTPTLNGTNVKRIVAGSSAVTFSSGTGTLSWGTTLPFTPVSFSAIASVSTAQLYLCRDSGVALSTTGVGLKCFSTATGPPAPGFTGTITIYWSAFE